jgi:hypothetical protein
LAVDRPLGLHGLRLEPRPSSEDRARPRARHGARRHLRECGRARRRARPDAGPRLAPDRGEDRPGDRRRSLQPRRRPAAARPDRAFRRGGAGQRLPLPGRRHRGGGRRHRRARRTRPPRHDRRSGRGDLSLLGTGRAARARGRPAASRGRCRLLGRDLSRPHHEALFDIARRRGWTITVHHTDRPATEAALRVVTLVQAARGGHIGPVAGIGG